MNFISDTSRIGFASDPGKWTKLAIAVGAASLALAAVNVTAEETEEEQVELETYSFTGSRIAAPEGYAQTSPVTVVTGDAIKNTGITRIEDVLNRLPSVEPAQTAFIVNGSSGTASLDLRGLGANRTLVLVNGRRMPSGGIGSISPDVNTIPTGLIEKVEVLTGGASAIYGADAVAGVVNFVTRDVDGVEISAGYSGYQHNNDNSYIQGLMDDSGFDYPKNNSGIDGETYNIDLIMGSYFDDYRGHATVYATWQENNELLQGSRDYSSCALDASGTACGGSGTAPVPNFFVIPSYTVDGELSPDYSYFANYYTLQPDSSLAVDPTGNLYNYGPINHFMRPATKYNLGATVDYEINKHVKPYMEVAYSSSSTRAQIAQSGTFFYSSDYVVDDSMFPQEFSDSLQDIAPDADLYTIYIGKRNVEGGPRYDSLTNNSFRIVLGTEGELTDTWSYDAYYLHASTTSSSAYINDLISSKIGTAVDSEACAADSNCVPYEVFTYDGVTPEAAAGLSGTGVMIGETTTQVLSGVASGEVGTLPWVSVPAYAAVGVEHREEYYESISDTVYAEGQLSGQGGPIPSLVGGYSVNEIFGEISTPILEGLPGVELLNANVAYRYSDYDLGFTTDTYRAGLDWTVIDEVRVRTGFNRAVRVPNVSELYSVNNIGLWSGSDPCAGSDPSKTAAECANTGVTGDQYGNIGVSPAGQYNQITGGNAELQPETSDSFTFGFVLNPIEGLNVSVDYWNIVIEDAISTIGAATILDICATSGQLCGNINRSGSGSLWVDESGYVSNTALNVGEKDFAGIDVAMNYDIPVKGGLIRADMLGTYMIRKETTPLPTDPSTTYDCVGVLNDSDGCFITPKWRHNFNVGYVADAGWGASATWRYVGPVAYEGEVDTLASDQLGVYNYLDLSASYVFMEESTLTIGVNNVFDKEPPLLGNTFTSNANTVPGFYDPLGRYVFSSVTMKF